MAQLEFGDERYMVLAALKGFTLARQRYEDYRPHRGVDEAFIPLSEALWWSMSIDEGFVALDGDDYRQARDADQDGRILRGIRYARNRTGHQRALILQRNEGLQFPVQFPLVFNELVWRSADQLPQGRPDHAGLVAYSRFLQGSPARHSLDQCAAWFVKAQNRLGSALQGLAEGGLEAAQLE